jgi:predicted kinase
MTLTTAPAAAPGLDAIDDPAVIVLVGVSGSGKSTLAAQHWPAEQVLSLDDIRAQICGDPNDQSVTRPAVIGLILSAIARMDRRETTVVDATNLHPTHRKPFIAHAHRFGLPIHAVVLTTPLETAQARNDARPGPTVGNRWGRRVPAEAWADQVRMLTEHPPQLAEGFTRIHHINPAQKGAAPPPSTPHVAHQHVHPRKERKMKTAYYLLTDTPVLAVGATVHQDEVLGTDYITTDPRLILFGEITDLGLVDLFGADAKHPLRLALLEPLGEVTIDSDDPSFHRCEQGWKVTAVEPIDAVFGPQAQVIRATIDQAETVLNFDQDEQASARFQLETEVNWTEIEDAEQAAEAALDAAEVDSLGWRDVVGDVYGHSYLALAARDLIGTTPEWTAQAYATLTGPWREAFATPIHPGDQPRLPATHHDVLATILSWSDADRVWLVGDTDWAERLQARADWGSIDGTLVLEAAGGIVAARRVSQAAATSIGQAGLLIVVDPAQKVFTHANAQAWERLIEDGPACGVGVLVCGTDTVAAFAASPTLREAAIHATAEIVEDGQEITETDLLTAAQTVGVAG